MPTLELTFPIGSEMAMSAEAMRIEALTKVAEGGEVGAEVADAQPVVPLFLDRNDSRAPVPTSRPLLMPFGVGIFFGGDVDFFGTSVGGLASSGHAHDYDSTGKMIDGRAELWQRRW